MNILKQLAFIPLVFLVQTLYGQKKKRYLPPPPPSNKVVILTGNINNCVRTSEEVFASRMKRYPFNSSDVIQFVSFDGLVEITDDGEIRIQPLDPGILEWDPMTGIVKSPPDTIKMKEVISLTTPQVDSLTDILFNYGKARDRVGSIELGCYTPRNAIIFRDSNGKVVAFIEICFECQGTRIIDKRISLGEMCTYKLNMIKDLFRKVGIKYGAEKVTE
jgi:hypothetical protein